MFKPFKALNLIVNGFKQFDTHNLKIRDNFPFIGNHLAQRHFSDIFPNQERQKHTYIVGESWSGKSELLKYLFLERLSRSESGWRNKNKGSVVLIDPHGDLADELMKKKAVTNRDDLIILDPMLDEQGGVSFCINPFDVDFIKDSKTKDVYAQFLARSFTSMLKDGNQELSLQMETLLIPCIRVLIDRPGSTFSDLQRFMIDHENEDLFWRWIQSPNSHHQPFFKNLFFASGYISTKQSIATRCQNFLNIEWFDRILCQPHSTVNLSKSLNTGKKIIVNLSKWCLGGQTSEALGRFLVAMIAGTVFARHRQPKQFRTPVDLIIDECHLLLSSDIKTILSEARKFGLHLTLAQQHVGQEMNIQMRNTVLTNTSVKILAGQARTNINAMAPFFRQSKSQFINTIPSLRPWWFFTCTLGRNKLIKLPKRFLGSKQESDPKTWNQTKSKQLQLFYTKGEPNTHQPGAQEFQSSQKNHLKRKNKNQRFTHKQMTLPFIDAGPRYTGEDER